MKYMRMTLRRILPSFWVYRHQGALMSARLRTRMCISSSVSRSAVSRRDSPFSRLPMAKHHSPVRSLPSSTKTRPPTRL